MSSLVQRIAEEFTAAARRMSPTAVGTERRRSLVEALQSRGLPTARDENWRYANLRALEKVRFAPVDAAIGGTPGISRAALTAAQLPAMIHGFTRYTFVDGLFAPQLSAPLEHSGGSVRTMGLDPAGLEMTATGDLRFALLNEAFAQDGAAIRVAEQPDRDSCIELVFVASADSTVGASYPRVDVEVGAAARLGLIERHVSIGDVAQFVNGSVRVALARGASLKHYRMQQTGARTLWFDTLSASLAESSRYELYGISLGGASARSTLDIAIRGERAEVGLSHVSIGNKTQTHDTYARIEHVAPRATTRQSFRGIASDRARVACNSKIVVHKDARGTDSHQSLRGLLAGSEAEIDVRPQLEIYTDDVRCNHGATAGKLDNQMLFYLLSRGLEHEVALRLLKWAFVVDVVAKIKVPELRRQIEQSLASQLNERTALEELL